MSFAINCSVHHFATLANLGATSGEYIVPALSALQDVCSLLPDTQPDMTNVRASDLLPRDKFLIFLAATSSHHHRCVEPASSFLVECLHVAQPDDRDERLVQWAAAA
jgi:hypothetical protein